MQHDRFIGLVQARGKLADSGQAERGVRAVLETLGERIPAGLGDNIAAQLPHEVGEHLRRMQVLAVSGPGERFDRDEFIERVAERSGLEMPQAAYLTRVVFEVVNEATQGSVMEHVRESLPEDVATLVSAGSTGRLPPEPD